jgi:hypothetical protein
MKKTIFDSKGIFILVLILLTMAVIFILIITGQKAKSPSSGDNESGKIEIALDNSANIGSAQPVNPTELTQNYQVRVKQILGEYLAKQKSLPLAADLPAEKKSEWSQLASEIYDQLLGLRLPGEYKRIHFSLVSNFGLMVDGLAGDFKSVELAQKNIEELVKNNPWLVN